MSNASQLKDFQAATVNYVYQRFTDSGNPCNRFLVADEVGLGKTLVARGVIERFYREAKSNGKSQLTIIYICSNQSIASQNINRLNVDVQRSQSVAPVNRINDLAIAPIHDPQKSFLNIIALSPNTSFNISRGGGIVRERAILYHILVRHVNFSKYTEELAAILKLDVGDYSWNNLIGSGNTIIATLRTDVLQAFNDALDTSSPLHKDLLSICKDEINSGKRHIYRRIIGGLRRHLASICVKYLKPDLIIMDEFQRFKYLIDHEDEESEVKLITDSLFNDSDIKILLLSATPYKMYSLSAEEQYGDNHFTEFKFIIDFLLNSDVKRKAFAEMWHEYSSSLLHLEERQWERVKAQKQKVEKLLKSIIARTERITASDDRNTLLRPSKLSTLLIKAPEVESFLAADSIASVLKNVGSPVEYCKSSPFPFSFMEGYEMYKALQNELRKDNDEVKKTLKKSKSSFLPVEVMDSYGALTQVNAKLDYLLNDSLYNGGSSMLWIPPSMPYYDLAGPFQGRETYSKTLVFSSWIMVPKMIAALTSYECERLTIAASNDLDSAEEQREKHYFNTTKRQISGRLRLGIDNGIYSNLSNYSILYPCVTLSDIWNPVDVKRSLTDVVELVTEKVQTLLKQISINDIIADTSRKDDDRWALVYMLLLDQHYNGERIKQYKHSRGQVDWTSDGPDEDLSSAGQYFDYVFNQILFAQPQKDLPAWQLAREGTRPNPVRQAIRELRLGRPPADIARQLALLSIASPAICSYRFLHASLVSERELDYIAFYGAFRIGNSFRKFFNSPESIAVIDKHTEGNGSYWQNLIYYCAQGNIQSMIDEFATAMIDHHGLWNYMPKEKWTMLVAHVSDTIGLRTVSVTGHTYESLVKEKKPHHFRCHFGVALNQSIVDESDVLRSDRVRNAFNSPFRPFVLATTSIGQEGLDFHLYCRKILHWNLPANPVDFEQREGRINRFKNLAIRQNMAVKYRDRLVGANPATVWNQLFKLAIDNEKNGKSDLVPFWHVEPQNIFIERQTPTIPYSKEVVKLKNLLRAISVYRISLGQPRQEELVNYLVDRFNEDEIRQIQSELLINLSPYGDIHKQGGIHSTGDEMK